MSTNRRDVLLAGLLFSVSRSGAAARVSGSRDSRLLKLVRDGESAWSIGVAYLHTRPESRAVIADSIASALGLDETEVQQMQLHELESRIAAEIREDFALGRTAKLEGWTMSLTESRICALYALAA